MPTTAKYEIKYTRTDLNATPHSRKGSAEIEDRSTASRIVPARCVMRVVTATPMHTRNSLRRVEQRII